MECTDLSCPICLQTFDDETVVPKIITVCGHSICDGCLQVYSRMESVLQCPICKRSMGSSTNFQDLPINYALKNIAVAQRRESCTLSSNSAISNNKLLSNHCSLHKIIKNFRCDTCEEWICSTCGMMDHKHCNTRPACEALNNVIHGLLSELNDIIITFKDTAKISEKAKIMDRLEDDIRERKNRIQDMQSVIAIEANRIEELTMQLQKSSDADIIGLQIVELLEKSSLKLANTNICFSDFIRLELNIRSRIQILNDIMSNIEIYSKSDQACSIDEEQQFKNKILMLSMQYDKKTVIECSSDSASLPLLLQVEAKDSNFYISSFLHYCPKKPEIKVTENLIQSLSKLMSIQLLSGTETNKELGEIHILKNIHNDPLFDLCLGLLENPMEKIKLNWSYDGWLSSPVLHIPGIKLPEKLRIFETRTWKEGEVALTYSAKKKLGTRFRILFCCSSETQFEHSRISLGNLTKGQDILKDAFERSRRGEPVKMDKFAMVGDI